MTAAILVWILMTTSKPYSGSTHAVQYSPPVAELADCQRMKDALGMADANEAFYREHGRNARTGEMLDVLARLRIAYADAMLKARGA